MAPIRQSPRPPTVPSIALSARLHLLGRLELSCDGATMCLPDASQRLLAFLALRDRHQHRSTVAGTLWMDTTEERAAANLRTALWRLRKVAAGLVLSDGSYLRIGDNIRVDLAEMTAATRRLVDDPTGCEEPSVTAAALSRELLPEWHDDWVLLEREQLRQVRLHGLEALCRRLTGLGRFAPAIEAGLLAVGEEPLRETTQRALIAAHLAEGNVSEAVRQYDGYRALLWDSLAVRPGAELRSLVAPNR
jgi:DNA-binding SARP family transcriptional activator